MTQKVLFEKIVGGAVAMGYVDGLPCFAAGPLPGETAEVEIIKQKPNFKEAVVKSVTESSRYRTSETEDHYLACSPWQNVDYPYQLKLKKTIMAETFGRPGLELSVSDVLPASERSGYRNKLEFSVLPSQQKLQLAFHTRGSYDNLVTLPNGCSLGSDAMNHAALKLADRAQKLKLGGYIETLIVRQSHSTGQLLGHIALHQVPLRDFEELALENLAGLVVSRVRRRNEHELVWSSGATSVIDSVAGNELEYPYNGFFQTNVAMFEHILAAIIKNIPKGKRVLDVYGGVGTIGIAAAAISSEVIGVEMNAAAVSCAESNADRAALTNYTSVAVPAQRLEITVFDGIDCVIVDPPRSGLEKQLVCQILEAGPERLIYLSCNPATQARDIMLLGEKYRAGDVMGFDLYPGTLHMESLVILDKI